ncbi:AI-2E family transporter [Candidatus Woesearchaeota archaeon]|nr:AI-2E family transporter [Candidatus Woesearchaeota archaeon]
MEGEKISKYAFIVLLLVLLYFSFILVKPFFTYIFMALILTISVYPFYNWMQKLIKRKKISSLIVILLILLIIIIPSFFVVSSLVKQTVNLISSFDSSYFEKVNSYIVRALGPKADLSANLDQVLINIKDFILKSTFSLAGSVADIGLGLFIMFFIMYYGFKEGDDWASKASSVLPLNKIRKEKLLEKVKEVTKSVIYGQVFIALLQGTLGGIGFFALGLKSPVFWGFIMSVLAFLPVVGTGLVWGPAGIIEIINGNTIGGIALILYGLLIVSGIDYLIRPKIISGKGRIHPIIALIGVLGGLKVFGLIGIIIGPVIAALFVIMAEFFFEDYVKNNKDDKHVIKNNRRKNSA